MSCTSSNAKGSDSVTPYANVGIFRALTFSWINPVISLGHEKDLDLDDIPQLNSANSVYTTFPVLQKKLGSGHGATSRVTKYTIAKALFLSAWPGILWTAFLSVIYAFVQYVCPYLIDNFVQCLNGGKQFKNQGYTLALIFSVATFLEGFLSCHRNFKLQQIGMRLRGAVSAMIFDKSLTLPSQSSGELVNLVGVDVENIDTFTRYIHDPWLIILQVILGLLLLYKNLGPASFVALAATLSVMFSNSAIAKFQEKYQMSLMDSRDNRMKKTTETLRNMRVLKLQGWEMSFLSKIFELRNVEALWLRKFLYSSVVMNFVLGVATTFVALVTFGSCFLMGIPLETGKILSSLATFRVLERPIYMLPGTISIMIQAKVSIGRIASFLCRDELLVDSVEKLTLGSSNNIAIEIVDGNFTWDMDLPTLTLKNINLRVNHGMKVAVCGKVGSGKSSLGLVWLPL